MNRTRVVPLVVALLCISAIGVSSNTLESSLSTEPDEAIDPDYDALPIGQDDVVRVFEEMGEAVGDESDEPVEEDPADAEPADDGDPADAEPANEGTGEVEERDGEPEDEAAGGGEAGPEDGGGPESLGESLAGGGGSDPDEVSLLDRLLALLAALLRALLPVLAVLAVAAVLYHYRHRILALLWPGPDASGDGAGGASDDRRSRWPDADPSNAIDRAWLSMVTRLDPDRPAAMTTAECAADAVEVGMEPDAVEAITSAFEEVHYGGASVTEERERRARQSRRRLEGEAR